MWMRYLIDDKLLNGVRSETIIEHRVFVGVKFIPFSKREDPFLDNWKGKM